MTDTITERIHAKADADLKKKLSESLAWVWNETGHGCELPKLSDFPDVTSQITNTGAATPTEMPWIGATSNQFAAVAFAYLRDKYRARAVADFMAKVESMAAEFENLGIAIAERGNE